MNGVLSESLLVSTTPDFCKVLFIDSSVMQLLEGVKLLFSTLLHDRKAHNIKTLQGMRAMWGVAVNLNVILLAVLKQVGSVVGAVPIHEQDTGFLPITSLHTCLRVKILLDPV